MSLNLPLWQEQIGGLSLVHACYARSRHPEIQRILLQELDMMVDAEFHVITGMSAFTGAIIARQPGECRVALAGINSRAHSRVIAVGYGTQRELPSGRGFNGAFARNGRTMWEDYLKGVLRQQDKLIIHGHSAGGAVGEVIARFVRAEFPDMEIEINTYGSPCPGGYGDCLTGRRTTRKRFMLVGDPVPLVPYGPLPGAAWMLTVGNTILALSPGTVIAESTYAQPAGGILLQQGGPTPRDVPMTLAPPYAAITRWYDNGTEELDHHDADTYRIFFIGYRRRNINESGEEVLAQVNFEVNFPPERHLVMPFVVPGTTEANVVMPLVLRPDGIAIDSAGRPAGSTSLGVRTMAFLKLGARQAFRRVKIGEMWFIVIGERQVVMCDQGKTGKTLMRRLNGMLKAVGTDQTVFLTNLLDGLRDWFTEASSGPPVSNPAVRVDL